MGRAIHAATRLMERQGKQNHRSLGLRFRNSCPGPEKTLVDWFIDEALLDSPPGCQVSLFREPWLESGFPDLVFVSWDTSVASRWSSARMSLCKEDIRLVHFIHQEGPKTTSELHSFFGKNLARSLARLEAAEMLIQRESAWKTPALSKIFAVRSIVTIEAKISEWSRALQQALLNTWFASHSYVLVPHVPRGELLLEAASQLGIGVWAKAAGRIKKPVPTPGRLPRSYASWLFNEWVWRSVYDGESSPL